MHQQHHSHSVAKDLVECALVFLDDLPTRLNSGLNAMAFCACSSSSASLSRSNHSETTWYTQPEETLKFFKEEKLDGAVYNIFLKTVRYHTSPDELDSVQSPQQLELRGSQPRSKFYLNIHDDSKKATLQWRLEEVRVIRYGTLPRLVEALSSETGEMDSSYVDAFLATFRTFATTNQVMNLLLERYKAIADDMVMKQPSKEGHKRSIRTVILGWLDTYPEDFEEPPAYPTLTLLKSFAQHQLTDNVLVQRLRQKISEFMRKDEKSTALSIDDITVEFGFSLQSTIHTLGNASRSVNHSLGFNSIPSRVFAEQLTYIDAELFKKVIPYQCLGSVWSRRNSKKQASQVATVYATVNQFNIVSYRVIATVLKCLQLPYNERALIVERWIDIAQELRILKNFSSLKAIISGLQSTSVFRLTKVWAHVNKSKLLLFDELAEIFSEENNQQMCREVLYREGTAKYADPETVNTVRGRKGSGVSGLAAIRQTAFRRVSMFQTADAQIIQGTVPYLGTFLTDMTMIDTAFPDFTEEGLINFEKRRKEFEILTQIRLLQCSSNLYKIKPEPDFMRYFTSLRVYDDNESYELSCEIQPESSSSSAAGGTSSRHRRRSSLGYFTVRRAGVAADFYREPPEDNFAVLRKMEPDQQSLKSLQGAVLPKPTSKSKSKSTMRHSISVGSLLHAADLANQLQTNGAANESKSSADSIVARIYFEAPDSNETNEYKSVLLTNSDRTQAVIKTALQKYSLGGRPQDYCLFQRLADNTELLVPEKTNVFYAVNTRLPHVSLVLRRRLDWERSPLSSKLTPRKR